MENKLGEFIKNYRQEHDLSLRQFGTLCGVSHTHIDSIERGADPRTGKKVKLTNDMIERIATATNQLPSYVLSLSLNYDNDERGNNKALDDDIRMIQRARTQMSDDERERMIGMLKMAFPDFFEE